MRKNIFSVFTGNPIENLRRRHRLLWRMGIQGPGNRAPAVVDHLLGKLPRLGFVLEFTGRASGPALPIVALGRDIRTIGNVPNIVICQVLILEKAVARVFSFLTIQCGHCARPSDYFPWSSFPSRHDRAQRRSFFGEMENR